MSDFNAALLHDMAFSKLKWCDYDVVSQGCSKAPKLMWRQKENNGVLKQQASLHRHSVIQGHENSYFSLSGMNLL